MEASNILALNLMHEIVTGKRSAIEAGQAMSEHQAAFIVNRPELLAENPLFELPQENTIDLDQMAMGS